MRTWRSALLFVAALAPDGLAGPPPRSPATLYVVENLAPRGVVDERSLVRLTFGKDGRVARETILTRDQRFFGHSGGHRLVTGGRFLATAYGGVVDLVDRKVIHDEELGKLLGLDGGRVVFLMENANRQEGYFAFDTATRSLSKLKDPGHWDLPGAKSPDRTKSVHRGFDAILRLYRVDGTAKDLGRTFRINYSPLSSSHSPEVPCLWLDDRRILTQEANGKLAVVDVDGKVEPLLAIPDAPAVVSPTHLARDPRGRVLYTCGALERVIDVDRRKAVPFDWLDLGHGFEASREPDGLGRHEVRREGQSIGRWKFSPHEAATAPRLIAFPFCLIGDNLGYPEGVLLWSPGTGWQSAKLWPNDVVGWAEGSTATTP